MWMIHGAGCGYSTYMCSTFVIACAMNTFDQMRLRFDAQ